MLTKKIENSWDWGFDKPIQLMTVKEAQYKIQNNDNLTFTKKASTWYAAIEPEDGSTFVSALFLGACEAYSCNKNGDSFTEEDLKRNHHTFVSDGHHFKHHKNNIKVDEEFGTIKATWYNPKMRRVEGIIKVTKGKPQSKAMLEKVEQGVPVPLSMACRVKYDVCSKCGNKAKTLSDYCTHLKEHMTEIDDTGIQICAINPDPQFFDISEVVVGADPTAFTFKKVASRGLYLPAIGELTVKNYKKNLAFEKEGTYNSNTALDKKAILTRLAELEKKIEGLVVSNHPNIKYLKKGLPSKKTSTRVDLSSPDSVNEGVGGLAKVGGSLTCWDVTESNFDKSSGLHNSINNRNMFRSLLSLGDDALNIIPTAIPQNDSMVKYSEDISLTSNVSRVRMIKESNDVPLQVITSPNLLKVAALNVAILCSNPELLYDNTYSELLILNNMSGV